MVQDRLLPLVQALDQIFAARIFFADVVLTSAEFPPCVIQVFIDIADAQIGCVFVVGRDDQFAADLFATKTSGKTY